MQAPMREKGVRHLAKQGRAVMIRPHNHSNNHWVRDVSLGPKTPTRAYRTANRRAAARLLIEPWVR